MKKHCEMRSADQAVSTVLLHLISMMHSVPATMQDFQFEDFEFNQKENYHAMMLIFSISINMPFFLLCL